MLFLTFYIVNTLVLFLLLKMKLTSHYHFLDVKITRDNGSFNTSVFHKSTFTGLYTNVDSFIPFTFKKDLVMSLLNRYFNICSTYITFHSELDNFKKLFSLNGYPRNFLDNCIRRF